MSVMLRTTNPDAVNEIDPGRDRRVPYIGQTLLYYARPGEGRAGRHIGVAKCVNIRDDDMVDMIVSWDADDNIDKRNVPRKTEQNPFNSWGFTEYDDQHYQRSNLGLEGRIELAVERGDVLSRSIDALAATVEGHGHDLTRISEALEDRLPGPSSTKQRK